MSFNMHLTKIKLPNGKYRRMPVNILHLNKGDIVVLETGSRTYHSLEKFRDGLRKVFPNNQVIVFSEGCHLKVASQSPELSATDH